MHVVLDHFLSTGSVCTRCLHRLTWMRTIAAAPYADSGHEYGCTRPPAAAGLGANGSWSLRFESTSAELHSMTYARGVSCCRQLLPSPISPPPSSRVGGFPMHRRIRSLPPCAVVTLDPRRSGLYVCRHPNSYPMTVTADGLKVTNAAETLLACARDLGTLDVVIMADSALRSCDVTMIELKIAANQRRRGAPRLRQVIPLLDPRSESPWESVLRVLHRVADIPVEPQHVIVDEYGRFLARADLWIKGTRRIHEYDGAVHREAEVHQRDLKRERNLIMSDWQRFGFTSAPSSMRVQRSSGVSTICWGGPGTAGG